MKQLTAVFQNPDTLKHLNRRLPTITTWLLVVACAYTLAQLTWMLVPIEASISASTASQSKAKSPVVDNNAEFRSTLLQLTNSHLFGKEEKAAPKQAVTTDAPETKLNLVLRGVLAAEPMVLASAIISQGKAGKELIYGIGDTVPGNATVEAIHGDRVILNRNGRLETLTLPEENLDNLAPNEIPGLVKELPRGSGQGIDLSQSSDRVLGDIRRKILKDPTSFGDFAIPVPVSKNGKLQGYRLKPQGQGAELFSQVGLQASDIITAINGVNLNNPAQGISALRKLSRASSVNLTVLRGGVEVPLHFDLR